MSAVSELERAWKAVAGNDRIYAQFAAAPRKMPFAVVLELGGAGADPVTAPDGASQSVEDFDLRIRWRFDGGSLPNYRAGRQFVKKLATELRPPFVQADTGPVESDPSSGVAAISGDPGYLEFSLLLRAVR